MRTDALTALLLDPFLTFEEALRECGKTAPLAPARVSRSTAPVARAAVRPLRRRHRDSVGERSAVGPIGPSR
jgi:hypothetical protein